MKYHIERVDKYSLATITPKSSPTVSVLVSVDIHEERSVDGQATELMYSDALLSGTKKYSREEFLDAVNLLGASISVSVSGSIVTFTLKSRSENFNTLLKLFEEMITSPAFKSKELARIRTTTTNELDQAKEDSRTIAHEALQNSFYGPKDRKYSYSIEKTIPEVKVVMPGDLKALHTKVLNQDWTCSIAAEAKHCKNFGSLIQRIKKSAKGSDVLPKHSQKAPTKVAILKHIPSRANIDFSIGAPLPFTLHHPDFVPLSLGLAVLAKWGGFSGRLMSTVRELEGLTYGIYGRLEGFSGTEQGYWRIMTFFAPDKALQGLTSTFREIKKIHKNGISQVELDKFKTITNTSQILINDSIGGMLSDLHAYHCHGFSLQEVKEHKAKVNSLTLQEVNLAIKTYLNPSELTVSGAGPTMAVQKEIEGFLKGVQ